MGKVNCKFKKIGVNDQFGQSGKAAMYCESMGLPVSKLRPPSRKFSEVKKLPTDFIRREFFCVYARGGVPFGRHPSAVY